MAAEGRELENTFLGYGVKDPDNRWLRAEGTSDMLWDEKAWVQIYQARSGAERAAAKVAGATVETLYAAGYRIEVYRAGGDPETYPVIDDRGTVGSLGDAAYLFDRRDRAEAIAREMTQHLNETKTNPQDRPQASVQVAIAGA